jgi:hypothetical protein
LFFFALLGHMRFATIITMPDTRTHRGAGPQDGKLFAAGTVRILKSAVDDYSLLLTKGYAETSSLKLVGDRFELNQRQRIAVMRCACSDQQSQLRREHQIDIKAAAGKALAIDGYNVLITIEAALAGAPIFVARDGCCRDICGLHGTYRKVQETIPAAELIGDFFAELAPSKIQWYFDSPVSNSGRLKVMLLELAERNKWNWQIELSLNPDKALLATEDIIATSDSIILDDCKQWLNLSAEIISAKIRDTWLINLSNQGEQND